MSEEACRPPPGSTYLCIGQDLFSVSEYVNSQYNYSLHAVIISSTTNSSKDDDGDDFIDNKQQLSISSFVPSAFMVYTDLQTLRGLWAATDYGSGIQYANGLLDQFPSAPVAVAGTDNHSTTPTAAGLQIGMWLNGTQGCTSICNGEMDIHIERLIAYLEQSNASKIFLRLGYEFDNPDFGYSDHPELYILAFRKIVTDCRRGLSAKARARVMFVWHSWGAPMASKTLTLDSFYPGDRYVDWIGVSIFQQVFPWSPPWGGKISDVENVLTFAQSHNKPTMIAESTPFGGIELKQASKAAKETNDISDPWERWYGKVLDIIDKYDVSMWCYINCDWEAQPQWNQVGFGETRLSSNKEVMTNWHDKIISGKTNRTFLNLGTLDNCGKGTTIVAEVEEDWFTSDHVVSFILVPFIVASGAFFIPYFMLGGLGRRGRSTKKERKGLLAGINEGTKLVKT